jgi:hypothetical protein
MLALGPPRAERVGDAVALLKRLELPGLLWSRSSDAGSPPQLMVRDNPASMPDSEDDPHDHHVYELVTGVDQVRR